ncbi:hypothetical protein [Leptospirillum ferriphilum]|nr:hypothetical protein [Leptospirillum ferriphilum]
MRQTLLGPDFVRKGILDLVMNVHSIYIDHALLYGRRENRLFAWGETMAGACVESIG